MYAQLKSLHRQYGSKVNILLYPSDEFGGQELPSQQIPQFVTSKGLPTDGGGCILMDKVKVNGEVADEVWKLAQANFPGDIGWNFDGIFLWDASGKAVGRYTAGQMGQARILASPPNTPISHRNTHVLHAGQRKACGAACSAARGAVKSELLVAFVDTGAVLSACRYRRSCAFMMLRAHQNG